MAATESLKFGRLEKVVKGALRTDNDAKIIIQGADSQTGIGKTTLAIKLARSIDPEWSAEDKAFIDIRDYIDAHLNHPPGSVLLLDEIEAGADSRRFMSQENVDLSQAWATLRARNIAVIATLPSISMLDNRMIELADYWILVKQRGIAQPYGVKVNDFTGQVRRNPFPNDEHIQFGDLPDDDVDKQYLDKMKDEMIMSDETGYITESEHKAELEKAEDQAGKDVRNKFLKVLNRHTDMSQRDIADLDAVDVHQSTLSQIVNR